MQPPRSPYAAVVRSVPLELAGAVPRNYERIGDVVLLPLRDLETETARTIAAAYGRVLGVRTVARRRGIHGPWRVPDVETLWGDGLETTHVEDGIRYKLDLGAVMFSSGNLAERMRMGCVVRPSETVVDLFAGIGYFALPMAVRGHAAKVVACEVNPTAFRYLEENVRLNRAWAVEPRLGDCRQTAPPKVADRIVMGYLDGETYLDVAMRTAKDECTLHYHESTPIEEVPEGPWSRVESAANDAGIEASLLAVNRVKSYAPRIAHVVLDVDLRRRGAG